MKKFIQGPIFHNHKTSVINSTLLLSDGKLNIVEQITDENSLLEYSRDHHVIPGMIDMHIHGSRGADVMDGTPEALQIIADSLLAQGTTGFLATTMTAAPEKIEQVLLNVANFSATQTHGAKILGVHLEGPFIAAEFVGAQRRDLIIPPDLELFKHWQKVTNNIIKLVTIAPEHRGAIEFIRYLKSTHVIAAFGHSAATYSQTEAGIDAGITHATHLFNAMRGIHHRQPGAVTALLLRDEVYAELICDNKHLAPSIIDLSYRVKTADRLILVTDATRAQCMPNGNYELGGQPIILEDNAVRLQDGTLAGSVLTLPEAMKYTLAATGCSLVDIVKMTSYNPSQQLNVASQGAIILNDDYEVVDVIV